MFWGKCQMCLPFVCKRKWYEFCGKYPNMCFIWKMTSVNLSDTNKEKLFIAGPFVLSQVLFTTAIIYDGLTKLKSEHEPIGPCSLPFWFNCSLFPTNLLLTCQYERLFPVFLEHILITILFVLVNSELDEEMQSAVQDYLEQIGVNDDLAAFLHAYMENKEHTELIRWLKNVECHIKKWTFVGLIVCLTTLAAFNHNLGTLLLFEFIFCGVRYASDLPIQPPGVFSPGSRPIFCPLFL